MYEQFADLYDRLMDDFNYPAWADYYLALLSRHGVKPKLLCECGCGTGSMSIEFAKRRVKLIASDLSEDMLRTAQNKARKTIYTPAYPGPHGLPFQLRPAHKKGHAAHIGAFPPCMFRLFRRKLPQTVYGSKLLQRETARKNSPPLCVTSITQFYHLV